MKINLIMIRQINFWLKIPFAKWYFYQIYDSTNDNFTEFPIHQITIRQIKD